MKKHLDPVANVYVDLDKVNKAKLYNDYTKLVEAYRELRGHANDLLDVIDSECDRDCLCEFNLEHVEAYEAFRDNPDYYGHSSPSIRCVIIGDDGRALRGEDK